MQASKRKNEEIIEFVQFCLQACPVSKLPPANYPIFQVTKLQPINQSCFHLQFSRGVFSLGDNLKIMNGKIRSSNECTFAQWKVASLPMLVPLSFQVCILLLYNDQPAQSTCPTLHNANHTQLNTPHTKSHTPHAQRNAHTRANTHLHANPEKSCLAVSRVA